MLGGPIACARGYQAQPHRGDVRRGLDLRRHEFGSHCRRSRTATDPGWNRLAAGTAGFRAGQVEASTQDPSCERGEVKNGESVGLRVHGRAPPRASISLDEREANAVLAECQDDPKLLFNCLEKRLPACSRCSVRLSSRSDRGGRMWPGHESIGFAISASQRGGADAWGGVLTWCRRGSG